MPPFLPSTRDQAVAVALAIGFTLFLSHPAQAQAQAQRPESPWFQRALVGIETGPTGAEFGNPEPDLGYVARFDGKACIEKAAAAHCDYMVIWARDGVYAYYDSQWQPKAPGLGNRDVLRETVEAAKRHQMPVIAYCVLQYPDHILHQHPDWRMRDVNGQAIERVCFNSPYVDHVKKLLLEMASYGLDGFHLDMVDQGFGPPYGCWCDHCESKFRERFGREMPKAVSWDADWERMLEFRYDTSAEFEEELERYVKENWPGMSVDYNYHGSPPFTFEVGQRPVQHGVTGDFITGETGLWAFSPLGVGLSSAFFRAVAPDRRMQVVIQRGVRHYHDQTTRPLPDIRWETMTALAHGAFVTMVDKLAYDGWLDPVFYERLGVALEEAHDKKVHFGQPIHADVGIYFSHRTRDWIGREEAARAWQGFLGAHKALVYDHIPWAVVLDEHAGLERLQQFPVILLPNVGILREEEVDTLTEYVRGGGHLLITGATGLYDRYGSRLEASMLESLVGGRAIRVLDSQDNHVRFSAVEIETPLATGLRPDWPFLVQGPGVVYEATRAQSVGQLLKPHRTPQQRSGTRGIAFPMSADEPVGPAFLQNKVGKGTVLTLACSPGEAAASDFHITEARELLPRAIRHLLPDPLVAIEAPQFVETVVSRGSEDFLRVHCLARAAPPTTTPPKNRPYAMPALVEDTPLFRVKIRCRQAIGEPRALSDSTLLSQTGENEFSATIEDIHEVILIPLR